MEKRAGALIDVDQALLSERMERYFDKSLDWASYKLATKVLAADAARFDAEEARTTLLKAESYDTNKVVRYFLRPFDLRFAYYSEQRPLWNEPRPPLWQQLAAPNEFLVVRPAAVSDPEGVPVGYTRCLGDNDAYRGHAYYIPFLNNVAGKGLLDATSAPNLSNGAVKYINDLKLGEKASLQKAALIWHHALAVCFSPSYLSENADGLAVDWPRVPLPLEPKVLEHSASLGCRLAALLDTETDLTLSATEAMATLFPVLGGIAGTNLSVNAGWGRADSTGKIFPGREKITVREWSPSERLAIISSAKMASADADRWFDLLGRAVDVYLNDTNYWRAVPEAAWNYFMGGYQVIKKWLSYREETVLGRALTKEEVREVTAMVRRISAIVLMTDELNANYVSARDKGYSYNS
jgi:hypothetical protein